MSPFFKKCLPIIFYRFLSNSTSTDFCGTPAPVIYVTSGSSGLLTLYLRAFVSSEAEPPVLLISPIRLSGSSSSKPSLPFANPSLFVRPERLRMLGIRQEQPVDLKLPLQCRVLEFQFPECISAWNWAWHMGQNMGHTDPVYRPAYSLIITTATELQGCLKTAAFNCLRQLVRNYTLKKNWIR